MAGLARYDGPIDEPLTPGPGPPTRAPRGSRPRSPGSRRSWPGALSSVELTEAYLRRIERLDPVLHAVIETNPDARTIAARRDAERRAGRVRGPLHGIPVLVKDNIATNDAMETTAGLARAGRQPGAARRAIVTRLRAAGAVILGKANLSEWANFRGLVPPAVNDARPPPQRLERSGRVHPQPVRPRLGPVRLELRARRSRPAANLCAIAIGTETDGSIVCPAGQQRGRRPQADGRAGRPGRDHPDRPQPGHGRTDDPHRDRRRDRAERRCARRSATSRGRRLPRDYRRPSGRARCAAPGSASIGGCSPATRRRTPGSTPSPSAALDMMRRSGRPSSTRSSRPTRSRSRRRADRPVQRVQGRHRPYLAGCAARRCGRSATSSPSTTSTARTSCATSGRSSSTSRTRRPVSTTRPIARRGRAAWPRPATNGIDRILAADRLDAIVGAGLRRFVGAGGRRLSGISVPTGTTDDGRPGGVWLSAGLPRRSRRCSASRSTSRARSAAGHARRFAGYAPRPAARRRASVRSRSQTAGRTRREDLPADV